GEHQLLIFSDGPPRTLVSQSTSERGKFPPSNSKTRLVCDDGASMRVATIAGVGISMNSYWSVFEQLQAGQLTRVLPDYEVHDQSAIWLVYPRSNVLTAKVRVFIDFLIDRIGNPPVWETR
ncbi:MAG: LysR substrate-binding domain-containing protein, partial [Pseudomonadota bacterium]